MKDMFTGYFFAFMILISSFVLDYDDLIFLFILIATVIPFSSKRKNNNKENLKDFKISVLYRPKTSVTVSSYYYNIKVKNYVEACKYLESNIIPLLLSKNFDIRTIEIKEI